MMSLKKNPCALYLITLQKVAKLLLQQWKDTYYTNYTLYSEELKSNIGVIVPCTIYDQLFDLMVDTHARHIQSEKGNDRIPTVPSLIDSIITSDLRRLNLNGLRHMGSVKDEEIRYLENILTNEIPNLKNLIEISLQTSGVDSTLPTCNDEILCQIGHYCPNLKTLDISYNHTVTDKGLQYLVPSDSRNGCPALTKVALFECSVTAEGVSVLLKELPNLKFMAFRETGQSLLVLSKLKPGNSSDTKLELAHINNLGTISRTCKDLFKLRCDEKLVNSISLFCPKLNGLKVRVNDADVICLKKMSSISILELVFNLGVPSSPGSNTVQYLSLCGAQLISLSFVCDTFSTQYLKVVCEHCDNLKRFWIRCNTYSCDRDITKSDRSKSTLSNLEVFFFRVGCPMFEVCSIPQNVISYVLHKSFNLKEVVLAMKNCLLSDTYVQDLFSSIQTSKLKHVMLLVPHKNLTLSSLNLSMSTVETLISICPQLEQLGNLLVWDISLEEIQELRRQLKSANSALVLLYKMMYSWRHNKRFRETHKILLIIKFRSVSKIMEIFLSNVSSSLM